MKARRLVLLVLVYVSLDFGNCWMPGAFNFDPDESVDGVSARRSGLDVPATDVMPTARLRVAAGTAARGVRVAQRRDLPRPSDDWVRELRRVHGLSRDPASSTDDH